MEPKHVIGLSGGKDSTAMALRLVEAEPRDYEFICNETGDELPEMLAHWAKLEQILGKPLKRVSYPGGLNALIGEQGMLPNFRARWCTRILKIEPTIEYFSSLPKGSVLYIGLRADEEDREGGLYGDDVAVDYPMRRWGWGLEEVYAYLDSKGICIPARTDCARCYGQRVGEWRNLWLYHPEIFESAAKQERKIGHTFRSDGRDTWHASLDFLAMEFAAGRPVRERKTGKPCRVCSL